MGNLLYLIAVILIIGWLVGFFAYGASGLIHALLVIAIIAVLINIISSGGRRVWFFWHIMIVILRLIQLSRRMTIFFHSINFLHGHHCWRNSCLQKNMLLSLKHRFDHFAFVRWPGDTRTTLLFNSFSLPPPSSQSILWKKGISSRSRDHDLPVSYHDCIRRHYLFPRWSDFGLFWRPANNQYTTW